MKSILIAFALIGTIGTAPARAATCQDLRTKLNRLENVLDLESNWLNPASPQADEFGSQQEPHRNARLRKYARICGLTLNPAVFSWSFSSDCT